MYDTKEQIEDKKATLQKLTDNNQHLTALERACEWSGVDDLAQAAKSIHILRDYAIQHGYDLSDTMYMLQKDVTKRFKLEAANSSEYSLAKAYWGCL